MPSGRIVTQNKLIFQTSPKIKIKKLRRSPPVFFHFFAYSALLAKISDLSVYHTSEWCFSRTPID